LALQVNVSVMQLQSRDDDFGGNMALMVTSSVKFLGGSPFLNVTSSHGMFPLVWVDSEIRVNATVALASWLERAKYAGFLVTFVPLTLTNPPATANLLEAP
jgi:hypothetical protein